MNEVYLNASHTSEVLLPLVQWCHFTVCRTFRHHHHHHRKLVHCLLYVKKEETEEEGLQEKCVCLHRRQSAWGMVEERKWAGSVSACSNFLLWKRKREKAQDPISVRQHNCEESAWKNKETYEIHPKTSQREKRQSHRSQVKFLKLGCCFFFFFFSEHRGVLWDASVAVWRFLL